MCDGLCVLRDGLSPSTIRDAAPMTPAMTDDELMARIAGGDEDAFRDLVLRWERRVYAFFFRCLGSREDAEDLAQETFVRIFRSAGRYRARGSFPSYLFRIAGNLYRNEVRRRRRRPQPRLETVAQNGDRPDVALERRELAQAVRAAISHLPDRQQIAVILRRYEGLTYQEIADALGTSIPAVESLLHRASRSLREALKDQVGP
jgi:RNA polymerase sigma-70 factor (ECF subfamily)